MLADGDRHVHHGFHEAATSATVEPYVSDTIWLGKLNRGVSSRGMTKADAARLEVAKKTLREGQNDSNILALVAKLKNNPKIRWKDSIKDVIAVATNGVSSGASGA